jgi:riboflavin-specific deaminase-like protein
VSYAQTLDGRLATRSGSSQWISGPDSLRFAHELRASHDAIMVGVGTVLKDDPRLTVRLVDVPPNRASPLRVIVDSTLRTPLTANVLTGDAASGTMFATTGQAPAERRAAILATGAEVRAFAHDSFGRVDLAALLADLGKQGIGSLLVEGGAGLITELLRARLVDRLAVCIAPKILGSGIEAIGDLGIVDLARALRLRDVRMVEYGVDLVLDGEVDYPEDAHVP